MCHGSANSAGGAPIAAGGGGGGAPGGGGRTPLLLHDRPSLRQRGPEVVSRNRPRQLDRGFDHDVRGAGLRTREAIARQEPERGGAARLGLDVGVNGGEGALCDEDRVRRSAGSPVNRRRPQDRRTDGQRPRELHTARFGQPVDGERNRVSGAGTRRAAPHRVHPSRHAATSSPRLPRHVTGTSGSATDDNRMATLQLYATPGAPAGPVPGTCFHPGRGHDAPLSRTCNTTAVMSSRRPDATTTRPVEPGSPGVTRRTPPRLSPPA